MSIFGLISKRESTHQYTPYIVKAIQIVSVSKNTQTCFTVLTAAHNSVFNFHVLFQKRISFCCERMISYVVPIVIARCFLCLHSSTSLRLWNMRGSKFLSRFIHPGWQTISVCSKCRIFWDTRLFSTKTRTVIHPDST